MNIFTTLGEPIEWAIRNIYSGLIHAPVVANVGAFGIAVIITTLLIRTLLFPLFAWQLRNSRRMQEQQRKIGPSIQEVRKKYKGQPQKMTEEMQKVYREHGMSPFSGLSGCLPLLVQLPVIWGLYNGIRGAVTSLPHGADVHFLWASNVTETPNVLAGAEGVPFPTFLITDLAHPTVLILPLLAAFATFVQSRMMMQPSRPDMTSQEQSMQNLSKQMSLFMPIAIFFIAMTFQVGISLYWVTQSAYMVIQQYYMLGWGGLKVPMWVPGATRTTSLSYAGHARGAAGVVDKNGNNNGTANVAIKTAKPAAPVGTGSAARGVASRSAKARKKRR